MEEFQNENDRRAAALAAMRGAPPPQGSTGGDAHDCARPDAEALALYAEANDLPEYGGIVNPNYLARLRDRATEAPTTIPDSRPFESEINRNPGGGV